MGGENDGKMAKSPDFLELMSTMLLVKDRFLQKETHIEAIGGNDLENILPITANLSLNRPKIPEIAIRVVYGGTIEMPFRALGYILPALVYAENIGINTAQIQIIFPNNIASSLNALPIDIVSEQSRKFSSVARRYIRNFFPNLKESVVFLEDTPLEKGSLLRSELIRVTSILKNKTPENLKKELEQKRDNARSRINPFYGAAHVLIHDVDLPGTLVPLLPDQPTAINPNAIINIGGNKEQFFYKLRQAIKINLGFEYLRVKTLQFFTKHTVPPYFMTKIGDDMSLDSVLRGEDLESNSLATPVQHDLNYLIKITNSRGNLDNFLIKERKLYGK